MRPSSGGLLRGADLTATALFGLEGASAGLAVRLDLFGVFVVGFLTAVGGGIVRDVLLGDTPPVVLRSVEYTVIALLGAGCAVALRVLPGRVLDEPVMVGDALGLGLFCTAGATKALDRQAPALTAVLLGAMTGCGGGVLRDVMLNEVPIVLRTQIYAVAAAAGAAVTVLCYRRKVPRTAALLMGASACVLLRLLAVYLDWNLPVPGL